MAPSSQFGGGWQTPSPRSDNHTSHCSHLPAIRFSNESQSFTLLEASQSTFTTGASRVFTNSVSERRRNGDPGRIR